MSQRPAAQPDFFDRATATTPIRVETESPLLKGLTETQREAVLHTDGPLLVLAAAGSGKTLVITRRIARLIADGAPPWSILALTFTNKAAGEMRERVQRLIPAEAGTARGLTVTTFHAFCARLLRRYADQAGLQADYSIYDRADQKTAIKQVLESLNLSTGNFPPDMVLSRISQAKNDLLTPQDFQAQAGDFFDRNIARCYVAYDQKLRKHNAVDFDDLLLITARMLRDHPEVREELQNRFRYILIDEYQDTNRAQFIIAHALASKHRNICVVGDPDQSIYAWRGADISNILEFEKQYPDARVIKLGENFRSCAPILKIADHLIKHNVKRHDKPLYTTTRTEGPRPCVCQAADEHHEAALVGEFFLDLNRDHGVQWKDMAVFYRTNALSRVMEAALRERSIPYTIARGTAFYDRKEIKDALSYLRVILNPGDEVSLRRIINTPPRGIGNSTVDKITLFAIEKQISLYDALKRCGEIRDLNARAIGAVQRFVSLLAGWRGEGSFMGSEVSGSLRDLVARVIDEADFEAHFKKSGADEDLQRIENLDELITSAAEFEDDFDSLNTLDADDPFGFDPSQLPEGSDAGAARESRLFDKLRAYLEQVALVSDADAVDPDSGAVTLMTLHAAKGLEFDAVAMIGLEEGVLPHTLSRDSDDGVEEERRLCFVGITRAKERLLITHATNRTVRGITEATMPSRFLKELPKDELEWRGWLYEREGRGRYAIDDDDDATDRRAAPARIRDSHDWKARTEPENVSRPSYQRLLPVGSLVRHPQFGLGRIQAVQPGGKHTRVRVAFNQVGVKTLIAEYARLERVE